MKHFERSNGLDTALYKNYFFFYFDRQSFMKIICSVYLRVSPSLEPWSAHQVTCLSPVLGYFISPGIDKR